MNLIKYALLCLSVTIIHSVSAESFWRSLCNKRVSSFHAFTQLFVVKSSKVPSAMRYYSDPIAQRVQAPNPIDQEWVMVKNETLGTDVPFDDERTCKWVKEPWAVPYASYKRNPSSIYWLPKEQSLKFDDEGCVVVSHQTKVGENGRSGVYENFDNQSWIPVSRNQYQRTLSFCHIPTHTTASSDL